MAIWADFRTVSGNPSQSDLGRVSKPAPAGNRPGAGRTILDAVSVGAAVPGGGFAARVHSVFERAVNLRVAGWEYLVTVYSSATTDLPQGIRVGAERFKTGAIMPGQAAWSRDERLYLPGATIDLRGAREWGGKLRDIPCGASERVRAAREWLAGELAQRRAGRCAPAAPQGAEKRLASGLDHLRESAVRLDRADAERAAAGLVGLGQGLTPAGDDMLVGFTAGCQRIFGADSTPERKAFCREYCALLGELSARTNDVSRTYLLLASRGLFSSSLVGLVEAIERGAEGEALREAAEAVFMTGRSSGCDTVAGLLAGLAAWERDR